MAGHQYSIFTLYSFLDPYLPWKAEYLPLARQVLSSQNFLLLAKKRQVLSIVLFFGTCLVTCSIKYLLLAK